MIDKTDKIKERKLASNPTCVKKSKTYIIKSCTPLV